MVLNILVQTEHVFVLLLVLEKIVEVMDVGEVVEIAVQDTVAV
jgi:hypothetical protein